MVKTAIIRQLGTYNSVVIKGVVSYSYCDDNVVFYGEDNESIGFVWRLPGLIINLVEETNDNS